MKKDRFTTFIVEHTDTLVEVFLLYLVVVTAAAFSFHFTEGMALAQSFWLAFVTATSTGYGDVAPKTFGGQLTAVILMHTTIFVVIPLAVARVLSVAIKDPNAFTHEEQEEIKNTLRELTEKKH